MSTSKKLVRTKSFCGNVEWIGIADASRAPMQSKESVELVANGGILGEHHFRSESRPHRQVTLVQHEHLPVIAAILGKAEVTPESLRRNIVVSGINLASLKSGPFKIGEAVLEISGDCVPCALMEETVGTGAYAAMTGHGGVTCIVKQGGQVRVNDDVQFLEEGDDTEKQ